MVGVMACNGRCNGVQKATALQQHYSGFKYLKINVL
jgi:hypothetical protein